MGTSINVMRQSALLRSPGSRALIQGAAAAVPHWVAEARPKHPTQTGGTSGPSQSVFINVQGKSRFTVDEVNDLMEQLIERQRDGAQLVLVR
jgi:hypothetical protein